MKTQDRYDDQVPFEERAWWAPLFWIAVGALCFYGWAKLFIYILG